MLFRAIEIDHTSPVPTLTTAPQDSVLTVSLSRSLSHQHLLK